MKMDEWFTWPHARNYSKAHSWEAFNERIALLLGRPMQLKRAADKMVYESFAYVVRVADKEVKTELANVPRTVNGK